MDKPLVSVILCCYNQQKYVSRAIMSVLRQQCDFDFELIIGEDASTDHTADVCREIQSAFPEQVVLICNEKNKGLIRNYFDCISMAKGELIADCAGDDFWMGENRLQHLVDVWRSHPSISIVYGNYADYRSADDTYILHNTGLKENIFREEDFGSLAAARFLSRQTIPDICLSTSVFPKAMLCDYLEKAPEMFLNPDYPAEDISVTAALLMQGPAFYLNEVNLAYRVDEQSISHPRNKAKYFDFCVKTFIQSVDWAKFTGAEEEWMHDWMMKNSRWLIQGALSLRDKKRADSVVAACEGTGFRLHWKSRLKYILIKMGMVSVAEPL